MFFEGEVVGGESAWHGAGEGAGFAGFFVEFAVDDVHVPRRGGGSHFAAVDGGEGAVGGVDEDEAAAADTGVVAVGNAEGEGGGDGGVDGIATVSEGG